jgi:undecaprenyl-phosphate 4-deoxy-4-formamido-L-arabinose transferase
MSTPLHDPARLSIVVPVYQGELTLDALAAEVEPLTRPGTTPGGRPFVVVEMILVHDGAIDRSDEVMDRLAAKHPFIKTIWLSRNFGQHPATLAGMAGSVGDWVVTMDEDGQHDPADVPKLLDRALEKGASLVYARPTNPPPHGPLRNLLARLARIAAGSIVGTSAMSRFHSFRVVRGDIARSLAAYCGHGVYLDVALSWVVSFVEQCPVPMRGERSRRSGYSLGRLISHFWRLILTAGTRPLRLISILGTLSILVSFAVSISAAYEKFRHEIPVPGWTSLFITVCFFSGIILFSLGVIAEYLGVTLTMAIGKPLYLIVPGPSRRRSSAP